MCELHNRFHIRFYPNIHCTSTLCLHLKLGEREGGRVIERKRNAPLSAHIQTHTHTYIYIFINHNNGKDRLKRLYKCHIKAWMLRPSHIITQIIFLFNFFWLALFCFHGYKILFYRAYLWWKNVNLIFSCCYSITLRGIVHIYNEV